MILIFEQDIRKHEGKRFVWKVSLFKGDWQFKKTWRIMWGLWSLSYYPSKGIKDFYDHIESGGTKWHMK